MFVAGRWWSGSALWPGWQDKQVPTLGCTGGRAEGEGSKVWSESPVISPPSFLLLPCGGITWCRGTMCSPCFAAPSSPGALLPMPPAQRIGARATPREPLGLSRPPLPHSPGLKAPALKRCLCLQKALAALALSSLGAAGGGAAVGADGPCLRVWGPGTPRRQVVGGDPLSPLGWGRARLPLTWSVPS